MQRHLLVISLFFTGICSLNLFLSPNGNDTNTGLSFSTPIKTFAEIRLRLKAITASEPVIVNVASGTYRWTKELYFDRNDGYPFQVTFRGNGSAEIFGSISLQGSWKKQTDNIYVLEGIDNIIRDQTGKDPVLPYNSLFVNGARAVRARTPNQGEYFQREAGGGKTGLHYKEGDINPNWRNLNEAMLVYTSAWTAPRVPILSVDTSNRLVKFAEPVGWDIDTWASIRRYFVENIYEGLDAPGEYYLDYSTWKLYYYPYPWENINSTSFELPVLQNLLSLRGVPNQEVRGFTFENLSFKYTDWKWRNMTLDMQASMFTYQHGVVVLEHAKNITFRNVELSHLGVYAFFLINDCDGSQIVDSHLWDLANGGIWIQSCQNIFISNNYIHDGGVIFDSSVAFIQQFGNHNSFVYNEIANFRYSGVSLGWVWGFWPSGCHNNLIANNYIHDIGMGMLSDMAGVYHLGLDTNSSIRNNLVTRVNSLDYGGWGLYADEGSSDITWENNFVRDTKSEPFHMHYGVYNQVKGNLFVCGEGNCVRLSRANGTFPELALNKNLMIMWINPYSGLLASDWNTLLFTSDRNIFLTIDNPDRPDVIKTFQNGLTFSAWGSTTQRDRNSVYLNATSVFNNLQKALNFSDISTKVNIDFVPGNLAEIGPKKNFQKTQIPAWCPERQSSRSSQEFREDFTAAGTWSPTPNVEYVFEGSGSITVSNSSGATFTDANAGNSWEPHFYWLQTINIVTTVVMEIDFRVDNMSIIDTEVRQYPGEGFRTGFHFRLDGASGNLFAGKGLPQLAMPYPLPIDQWVRLTTTFLVAPGNSTFSMTMVTPAGTRLRNGTTLLNDDTVRWGNLLKLDPLFAAVHWVGFSSNGPRSSTFSIRRLHLTPAVIYAPIYNATLQLSANPITVGDAVTVTASSQGDDVCGYGFKLNGALLGGLPWASSSQRLPRMMTAGRYSVSVVVHTPYGQLETPPVTLIVNPPNSGNSGSIANSDENSVDLSAAVSVTVTALTLLSLLSL